MASAENGGGARYLRDLLPELRACGVESGVITSRLGTLGESLHEAGFDVAYVEMMGSRASPSAMWALRRALREQRPDVVHLHGTRAGFYGALVASWGLGATLVYTAHGIAFRREQHAWSRVPRMVSEALVCQVANRVMSVSRSDLQALEALPRWGDWVGRYVPNAVHRERYLADRRRARSLLGVSAEARVVGTVSRLVPQKAVDVFLAAATALDGVNAVVVGEGPLRGELEAAVEKEGGTVAFLGERDDVCDLLAGFDVFVLSSAWEGEPLGLLEAMAAEVPCVATDTAGSRAILAGGDAGLLVPIGNSEALQRAIERLLGESELRRVVLEGAGRVLASRSIEAHAGLVVEVYGDSRAVAQGAM